MDKVYNIIGKMNGPGVFSLDAMSVYTPNILNDDVVEHNGKFMWVIKPSNPKGWRDVTELVKEKTGLEPVEETPSHK